MSGAKKKIEAERIIEDTFSFDARNQFGTEGEVQGLKFLL
jgi:hypothetical protein